MSIEIMAPAGSFESLSAALNAGADSVYFGVGNLNMRARATANFTQEDLPQIVALCEAKHAKSYLTINTIIYNNELDDMHALCDAALKAGITAIIASDLSVITYAHSIGLCIHMSVQANVCNKESVRFFSQFADVMVLARELTLPQIKEIIQFIEQEDLKGPSGERIRIEIFAHGALCVAVSGKCYMSLAAYNSSANRGQCFQPCRRAYKVTDVETGFELEIDNKYVMSPKDICTIRVLDQLIEAGVSIFKLEGRGRSSDYVATITSTYKKAAQAYLKGTFTPEATQEWEKALETVFNRGFWHGGYYLGEPWNDWSGYSGSHATKSKFHVGRVAKVFTKAQVAQIDLDAKGLELGQEILITGDTTGALKFTPTEIRIDQDDEMISVTHTEKGQTIFIKTPQEVRKGDKVYLLLPKRLGVTGE